MEDNIENNNKSNNLFIIIVTILVILCLCALAFNYFYKSKINTNINENQMKSQGNDSYGEQKNLTIDNNETASDETQNDIITKKDEVYEYTYSNNEDYYDNVVISFKINGKEVIESFNVLKPNEINEVKKYKDFLVIDTLYANTGGPDYSELFIFDYNGNLLLETADISIVDLTNLTEEDYNSIIENDVLNQVEVYGIDKVWNDNTINKKALIGTMSFNSYIYDEKNKKLEINYLFNIESVAGEAGADGSYEFFCKASKSQKLYSKVRILYTFNNGKFENETMSEKKQFSASNLDESDKKLYDEYCNQ